MHYFIPRLAEWTGRDLNPRPPACKAGDLPTDLPARELAVQIVPSLYFLGGDPSAGSPTDTLLRLNPARRTQVRIPQKERPSLRPDSHDLTGGVCKEQGHIHRLLLTGDYYGFHVHEGELQPSIPTMSGFRDYLYLSVSEPIVPPFVARVLPGSFGEYGPTVAPSFLPLSAGSLSRVLSKRT